MDPVSQFLVELAQSQCTSLVKIALSSSGSAAAIVVLVNGVKRIVWIVKGSGGPKESVSPADDWSRERYRRQILEGHATPRDAGYLTDATWDEWETRNRADAAHYQSAKPYYGMRD